VGRVLVTMEGSIDKAIGDKKLFYNFHAPLIPKKNVSVKRNSIIQFWSLKY
jgi:hypothetical protein